jgi:hypothetical protein
MAGGDALSALDRVDAAADDLGLKEQHGKALPVTQHFSLISSASPTGRFAAEDMMEPTLTRAPLRRRSGAEPDDGFPPWADPRRRHEASDFPN